MNGRSEFDALVERAMRDGNRAHMRPVVEKELLHYDILFALDAQNLLDPNGCKCGTRATAVPGLCR